MTNTDTRGGQLRASDLDIDRTSDGAIRIAAVVLDTNSSEWNFLYTRRYYGYTRTEAIRLYLADALDNGYTRGF